MRSSRRISFRSACAFDVPAGALEAAGTAGAASVSLPVDALFDADLSLASFDFFASMPALMATWLVEVESRAVEATSAIEEEAAAAAAAAATATLFGVSTVGAMNPAAVFCDPDIGVRASSMRTHTNRHTSNASSPYSIDRFGFNEASDHDLAGG